MSPELQGVEVSISERGAATPLITVATNENGAYRYKKPTLLDEETLEAFHCQ